MPPAHARDLPVEGDSQVLVSSPYNLQPDNLLGGNSSWKLVVEIYTHWEPLWSKGHEDALRNSTCLIVGEWDIVTWLQELSMECHIHRLYRNYQFPAREEGGIISIASKVFYLKNS